MTASEYDEGDLVYAYRMWFPGDTDTNANIADAEDVCIELEDQNRPEELPLWIVQDLATEDTWTGEEFLAEFGG